MVRIIDNDGVLEITVSYERGNTDAKRNITVYVSEEAADILKEVRAQTGMKLNQIASEFIIFAATHCKITKKYDTYDLEREAIKCQVFQEQSNGE